MKFTFLRRDRADYLVDRYTERKKSAEELSKRVNQHHISDLRRYQVGGTVRWDQKHEEPL
jgi:hypothetical protein